MQDEHYRHDFRPRMIDHGKPHLFSSISSTFVNHLGYDSVYIKRSGDKSDGCCLFYKTDRLKLVASKTVPFYRRNIQLLDR